ncbi:hypothetical protein [Clostridium sp. AM42-4]|uniref:hypothetical protein n=1 Tax=Clostridium sp. AM42-4 TaxID=2292305 RepID=UPI000E51B8AE|nr:hypothetical protein [Clostridium sp. AM42-4]RHS88893.1 hypothetical protein DW922_04510 [Clostridium sp. AM42-4]
MKKKAAVLAAAVLLCAVWAAGCSETGAKKKAWDASENSIYVADDLSVQSAMVYTSQKENDLYSAEGLAEFAKKQICSYNEEQGAAAEAENTEGKEKLPAALEKSSLEGKTGTLVFSYATPEDFVRFSEENGDDTHSVTSLQVLDTDASKLPDLAYRTASGKSAELSKAGEKKDSHMVLTEGSAFVYTEGKILYVTEGVEITSDHSAVTPEGTGCIIFK